MVCDGYAAYKYYMTVKLHLTKDKFNIFNGDEFGGANREKFEKRNDRFIFEKIAKQYPLDKALVRYFVSNMAYGNDNMIYENNECDSNFNEWQRRRQSITKIFCDDLFYIKEDVRASNLTLEDVLNPPEDNTSILMQSTDDISSIFKLYKRNIITIESVVILNDIEKLVPLWLKNSRMLTWKNDLLLIKKLNGFVKYDLNLILNKYTAFKEDIKCCNKI